MFSCTVEKSQSEDDSKKPADDQLEREDVSEVTPSSPGMSNMISPSLWREDCD